MWKRQRQTDREKTLGVDKRLVYFERKRGRGRESERERESNGDWTKQYCPTQTYKKHLAEHSMSN